MKKLINTSFITSLVLTSLFTYAQSDSVLVDSRDGKVYKIVQIGSQTWTAQNLNYGPEISSTYELRNDLFSFLKDEPWAKEKSVISDFMNAHYQSFGKLFFCYMDSLKNCENYGALYSWESAQNACPVGWHLPSMEEYEELFNYFKRDKKKTYSALIVGGGSGFNSLLGGECFGFDLGYASVPFTRDSSEPHTKIPPFQNKGVAAFYWTSTETTQKTRRTVARITLGSNKKFEIGSWYLDYGFASSVRCIKD